MNCVGHAAWQRLAQRRVSRPSSSIDAITSARADGREFEHIRYGTQTLIAGFNVTSAAGCSVSLAKPEPRQLTSPSWRPCGRSDQGAPGVMDNLNTRRSEAVVRLHAATICHDGNSGLKGRYGALRSTGTRQALLRNPWDPIVFHFTPEH
jgi:hypothetical protein